MSRQIKSNLSLNSLLYYEACNEFVGPFFASLRLVNAAPFEEMLQRWRAVRNTVSDLPARDLNLKPPTPETNELLLDQNIFPESKHWLYLCFCFSNIITWLDSKPQHDKDQNLEESTQHFKIVAVEDWFVFFQAIENSNIIGA